MLTVRRRSRSVRALRGASYAERGPTRARHGWSASCAACSPDCLEALEPDLIILDEFQRFKHLLEGEDDEPAGSRVTSSSYDRGPRPAALGHAVQDVHARPRGGAGRPLRRLRPDGRLPPERPAADATCSGRCSTAYGREARTSRGRRPRRVSARRSCSSRTMLRQVMIRTERLGGLRGPQRHARSTCLPAPCRLETADVQAYLALQRIAPRLEQPDTLEYWKAAPYLLSFMDDYVLQGGRHGGGSRRPASGGARSRRPLPSHGLLSLKWEDVAAYAKIDPGNARLRTLMDDTVGRGALPPPLAAAVSPVLQAGRCPRRRRPHRAHQAARLLVLEGRPQGHRGSRQLRG